MSLHCLPASALASEPSRDDVAGDQRIAAPDAAAPSDGADAPDARATNRRAARVDGRSRRFRYGDALDDAPPRAVTGSIAISFAVVSRRNWPR
ncbi:hypothetical protein [Burkholderia dolosa]|uniref:hypothetical protein n=1 Tax=Burkholderia dolosa TaxID=152500 RepID=UPI001592859C|nr:hypothetical protein [Burkholderia dolosa]MBR8456299.1 hypothetical protein [Burkholderia dolosa]MBY4753895.1 hypothetical protein [Burkholderia dolosa]MBY4829405.1 hypothetical protein [Burkholderia dolosa]MDN7422061.1 hypothetical protein [Burkholderia dolosa]